MLQQPRRVDTETCVVREVLLPSLVEHGRVCLGARALVSHRGNAVVHAFVCRHNISVLLIVWRRLIKHEV